MDYRLLFPKDYIAAHDLRGKDVTKVIREVVMEDLTLQGGLKETKPVVVFQDAKKKLVLNKTNATIIAEAHGVDTDDWAGKPITMYPTTTQFGPNVVDCVRIRPAPAVASDKPGDAGEEL